MVVVAKINVTFYHPTNGSSIDVQLDEAHSADCVINELIKHGMLMPIDKSRESYLLLCKETYTQFFGDTTFAQAGIKENGTIRVEIKGGPG